MTFKRRNKFEERGIPAFVSTDVYIEYGFHFHSLHGKILLKHLSRKGYKDIFASFDLDSLTHVFICHSLAYGMSITS